jgi:hypothetical protein
MELRHLLDPELAMSTDISLASALNEPRAMATLADDRERGAAA